MSIHCYQARIFPSKNGKEKERDREREKKKGKKKKEEKRPKGVKNGKNLLSTCFSLFVYIINTRNDFSFPFRQGRRVQAKMTAKRKLPLVIVNI